jgi:hypothetical protein
MDESLENIAPGFTTCISEHNKLCHFTLFMSTWMATQSSHILRTAHIYNRTQQSPTLRLCSASLGWASNARNMSRLWTSIKWKVKCASSWYCLLRNYVTMIHGQQNIKYNLSVNIILTSPVQSWLLSSSRFCGAELSAICSKYHCNGSYLNYFSLCILAAWWWFVTKAETRSKH